LEVKSDKKKRETFRQEQKGRLWPSWLRLRTPLLISLGAILIWGILTTGLAAHLAAVFPARALTLNSNQASALLELAEKGLDDLKQEKNASKTIQDGGENDRQQLARSNSTEAQDAKRTAIRSKTVRALINDPLNARGFRIMGQLAVLTLDEKRAEAFMRAAVRRSLWQSDAVLWVMQHSYQQKDYETAISYAETLLRTRQQILGHVMPILGPIAESQDGAQRLRRLLASNPAWREGFFAALPGSISDARTPLRILLSLKDTTAPPTRVELRNYLRLLIDRNFYELAYYTWLQFLPDEELNRVGNLSNGGFENDSTGLPFDWEWDETPGVSVQMVPRSVEEGDRSLFLQFGPGRVNFSGVKQALLLPPGTYRLNGIHRSDLVSQRGLQWRVVCAGQENVLGESPFMSGRKSEWSPFEFDFRVPRQCPAQLVKLVSGARSTSEQFISGTISYDELRITKVLIAPEQSVFGTVWYDDPKIGEISIASSLKKAPLWSWTP
jgi:hypothetical protein